MDRQESFRYRFGERRALEIGLTILILLVIGAIVASLPRESASHREWYRQVVVLYVVVLTLSLGLVVVGRALVRRSLFILLVLFVSIVAVPVRGIDSLRLLFLLLISIAGFSCRSFFASLTAPVAYIGMMLLFRHAALAWPQWADELTNADLLGMVVLAGLIAVVLAYLEHKIRAEAALRREVPKLRSTIEDLTAANLGYSSFTQLARQQSALEERNRITREVHDGVGYTLTNIIMLSEVSLDVCPEESSELRENISAIRMQAKNGLFDTRRALRELRSTDADMPRGISAIRNLLITYSRATKIETKLELLVRSDLLEDSPLFLTVFRFVQEALTNTFRHGRSTRVVVRFQRSDSWLIVSVVDNGRGAAVVAEGIGLQGMRERVESLGGELTYNGVNGFTVAARLPIQEAP